MSARLDRVFSYVVASMVRRLLLRGASCVERDVLPAPRVLGGSLRLHSRAVALRRGLLERSIKLRSRWGWLVSAPT